MRNDILSRAKTRQIITIQRVIRKYIGRKTLKY